MMLHLFRLWIVLFLIVGAMAYGTSWIDPNNHSGSGSLCWNSPIGTPTFCAQEVR